MLQNARALTKTASPCWDNETDGCLLGGKSALVESWAGNIHILPEVLPVPTSPGHLLEALLPAGDGALGVWLTGGLGTPGRQPPDCGTLACRTFSNGCQLSPCRGSALAAVSACAPRP